jgi:L-ribulokinase
MEDVARAAGVSHQTVFRVVNDLPGVRGTTRLRVLAAVDGLGYRRNGAARALVTGRSQVLGVITLRTSLYGPASALNALERAAYTAGYFLSVATLRSTEPAAIKDAVDRLVANGIEGAVVIAPVVSAKAFLRWIPVDLPLVVVEGADLFDGAEVPGGTDLAGAGMVGVDQAVGARVATSFMLKQGHATVWHVAGPPEWLEAGRRVAAWRATLEAHGAEAPPPLRGDWSAKSGFDAGRMLARISDLTAVFAANDSMALGVLRALHEAGRQVPAEVSVVGFDDVPEAPYFNPPLTTVRQDFDEVGRRSLDLLLGQIKAGARTRGRSIVSPTLVVRESAARVASPPVGRKPRSRRNPRNRGPGERELGSSMSQTSVPADAYVIGVDYGTLSGRAVVVRVSDGAEMSSAVHEYRHGVMDTVLAETGAELPPDWALQHPADYVDVLRDAVPKALAVSGVLPDQVVGIGTDFTACTVLPVLADGTPLCQVDEYVARPHAYAKLWKHHAAQPQADRINALAEQRGEPWLARYGGKISSEWEFAKALQVLEEDPLVYAATARWIEAADWIIWQLCGVETRNVCTAGYKGIFQDGDWPSREFLAALNPEFAGYIDDLVRHPLSPLGCRAGGLSARAAAWTGLPAGIAVSVGNVDAHVTAPAAKSIAPGQMLAVMGTSTCHVMNGERLEPVPGMCGVVADGIVQGLWGYEAGQSGVGDIFGWFVDRFVPASYEDDARSRGISVHELLSELAASQQVGEHGLVALDWQSGNRSVLVDHDLSGVLVGMTLATKPEDVYRALVEATAFGTRTIVETFNDAGLPVTEFVVAGGLLKNAFVMQIYSDVLDMPLHLLDAEHGPALGSAIHAAVAAGGYPSVAAASAVMGRQRRDAYLPQADNARRYDVLYGEYRRLHDYFGRGQNDVMRRLRRLRNEVSAQ